ncbi:phosphotransferase family protein [Micromonospora sp. NPDC049900]|uniref:phosphotransferase family protein n=1 Tax=Micromonospora sp. NPDC049900 TaxID=3364275 RepID=UPI0037A2EC8B
MTSVRDRLSRTQRDLLDRWLPDATVIRDLGWDLLPTTVLEVVHDGARYVVKAGGPEDQHIARELRAHHHWLTPWTSRDRAPVLMHGDESAKLLVTRHLPGELVLDTAHVDDPDAYRQAGELLALLHAQTTVTDDDYEARENARTAAWLAGPHRIAPATVERLRAEIATWPTPPATLVPTHGDWQPRNWLVHQGRVSIIDFGRAALRPAYTDLGRLAVQDFRRDPTLERAFLDGYGTDPREPGSWRRTRVRDAIATAGWAYRVGDERFEEQGHRMIRDVLAATG